MSTTSAGFKSSKALGARTPHTTAAETASREHPRPSGSQPRFPDRQLPLPREPPFLLLRPDAPRRHRREQQTAFRPASPLSSESETDGAYEYERREEVERRLEEQEALDKKLKSLQRS